jgi:hypothetical protein
MVSVVLADSKQLDGMLFLKERLVFVDRFLYIGHFIMYSGITKIYYRKTVGNAFTKPVHIEGKTQFSPQ